MSKYWTIEELKKVTREEFDQMTEQEQIDLQTQSRKIKAEQEQQDQEALDQKIQQQIEKHQQFITLGEQNLKYDPSNS